MQNFGEVVRDKRKALKDAEHRDGYKIAPFAELVGVDPVYITQIEKHNKLPSVSTAKKICAVLGDESLMQIWKDNKLAQARKIAERSYNRTASSIDINFDTMINLSKRKKK